MNLQRTSKGSCGSSFSGLLLAEVEIQVKGGTSLHKTFREYNLVFKGLINGPETNSAAVVDQAAITTFPLGMYLFLIPAARMSVVASGISQVLLYLLN